MSMGTDSCSWSLQITLHRISQFLAFKDRLQAWFNLYSGSSVLAGPLKNDLLSCKQTNKQTKQAQNPVQPFQNTITQHVEIWPLVFWSICINICTYVHVKLLLLNNRFLFRYSLPHFEEALDFHLFGSWCLVLNFVILLSPSLWLKFGFGRHSWDCLMEKGWTSSVFLKIFISNAYYWGFICWNWL